MVRISVFDHLPNRLGGGAAEGFTFTTSVRGSMLKEAIEIWTPV